MAKVALAFDFQPASTGEMEAVVSPVLSHLSVKGVSLTVVSTVPTGSIQAERLLSIISNKSKLPPAQTTPWGISREGLPAWLPLLNRLKEYCLMRSMAATLGRWIPPGCKAISDFDLFVIVTDSSDTGRAWIEQVQPLLEDKPLAMVLTAQTEPLVRPYYETDQRQVSGLISGMSGGASYQAISGGVGPAIESLASFKLGGAVAAILMLVGAVTSALSGIWLRERAAAKGKTKS